MKDENSNNDNIITLWDDEGNDVKFEFLDLINYNEKDYVILLPAEYEDIENEENVFVDILQLEENDDEDTESYTSVEDEEILQAVFEKFKQRHQDECDFVD